MTRRKPNLYFDRIQREVNIHRIQDMKKIYDLRIKKAISMDTEAESQAYKDDLWNKALETPYDPNVELADIAEDVEAEGFHYYLLLENTNYILLIMWICCICELWEQQILSFLYREKYKNMISDDGKDLAFDKAIKLLKKYGVNIKEFNSWEKIKELRALVNVIKHGEGRSERQLRELRPDYFDKDGFDLLKMFNNSLENQALNVKEQDMYDYIDALISFWNEFPVDTYLEEVE